MGCQQSIYLDETSSPSFSSSVPPVISGGTGGTDKALGSIKPSSPTASTESIKTTRTALSSSTVSLAVDEDVSYLLPKLDYNGNLLTEEIVKRTSSSIQSTVLSIGKGTNKFELKVSRR